MVKHPKLRGELRRCRGALLLISSWLALLAAVWTRSGRGPASPGIDAFLAPPATLVQLHRWSAGAGANSGAARARAALVFGVSTSVAASARAPGPTQRADGAAGGGVRKGPLSHLKIGDVVSGNITAVHEDHGLFIDIGFEKDVLCGKIGMAEPIENYRQGTFMEGLRVSVVDNQKGVAMVTQLRWMSDVAVGEQLQGNVTQAIDTGVFFNAGLHKQVWAPIAFLAREPSEYVKDSVVDLIVISSEKGRVRVADKAAEGLRSPLRELVSGEPVQGNVTAVSARGACFVDIGVFGDALLRDRPEGKESWETGEQVIVRLLTIRQHRIYVTTDLDARIPNKGISSLTVGEEVSGTVRQVGRRGIMIDVGLNQEVSCKESKLEKPVNQYRVGDVIEKLTVISIDGAKEMAEVSAQPVRMSVKVGETLTGTVVQTKDFGVFFDIGLPGAVLGPAEWLTRQTTDYEVGSRVDLIVIKVKGERVTVSDKPAEELLTLDRVKEGTIVKGTVKVVFMKSGSASVDIGCTTNATLAKTPDGVFEGDEIEDLIVVKVDPEAYYAVVSKLEKLPTDREVVEGPVTRLTSFGLFVDVGGPLDALLMASRLPKPLSEYEVGEKIEDLKVSDVEPDRKHLVTASIGSSAADFEPGDTVEGTVTMISDQVIFVNIGPGVEVLVSEGRLEKGLSEYSVGEVIHDLKVVWTDPVRDRIGLASIWADSGGPREEPVVPPKKRVFSIPDGGY